VRGGGRRLNGGMRRRNERAARVRACVLGGASERRRGPCLGVAACALAWPLGRAAGAPAWRAHARRRGAPHAPLICHARTHARAHNCSRLCVRSLAPPSLRGFRARWRAPSTCCATAWTPTWRTWTKPSRSGCSSAQRHAQHTRFVSHTLRCVPRAASALLHCVTPCCSRAPATRRASCVRRALRSCGCTRRVCSHRMPRTTARRTCRCANCTCVSPPPRSLLTRAQPRLSCLLPPDARRWACSPPCPPAAASWYAHPPTHIPFFSLFPSFLRKAPSHPLSPFSCALFPAVQVQGP
jgi:hypothetical protein